MKSRNKTGGRTFSRKVPTARPQSAANVSSLADRRIRRDTAESDRRPLGLAVTADQLLLHGCDFCRSGRHLCRAARASASFSLAAANNHDNNRKYADRDADTNRDFLPGAQAGYRCSSCAPRRPRKDQLDRTRQRTHLHEP